MRDAKLAKQASLILTGDLPRPSASVVITHHFFFFLPCGKRILLDCGSILQIVGVTMFRGFRGVGGGALRPLGAFTTVGLSSATDVRYWSEC